MNLPKFADDSSFANLRERMGARPSGRFSSTVLPLPLPAGEVVTEEELSRLAREGMEVTYGAVRVLEDGTLAFKNRRVFLYIRVIGGGHVDDLEEPWGSKRREVRTEDREPRFHVAHCRTLESMRQKGRGGRYVVAVRDDGRFDLVAGGTLESRSLRVCKNCLEKIDWKDFSICRDHDRDARVAAFSIAEFFGTYGRTVR